MWLSCCPKTSFSINLHVYPYISMPLLWLLQPFRNLEVGKYEFSTLFFFYDCLTILCLCFFVVNFRISLWISAKKKKKTAEVVLYLVINFGSTVILTILKFPFCKHGVYLRLFLSSLVSFNSFFFFHFQFCLSFAVLIPIFWCCYKWDFVLNLIFKSSVATV